MGSRVLSLYFRTVRQLRRTTEISAAETSDEVAVPGKIYFAGNGGGRGGAGRGSGVGGGNCGV